MGAESRWAVSTAVRLLCLSDGSWDSSPALCSHRKKQQINMRIGLTHAHLLPLHILYSPLFFRPSLYSVAGAVVRLRLRCVLLFDDVLDKGFRKGEVWGGREGVSGEGRRYQKIGPETCRVVLWRCLLIRICQSCQKARYERRGWEKSWLSVFSARLCVHDFRILCLSHISNCQTNSNSWNLRAKWSKFKALIISTLVGYCRSCWMT